MYSAYDSKVCGLLRLVAITMHSMCHLPGSLAACFTCVCACILHGAARKSTVQATEAGTKVQVNGLSKDTQFNGRIGHITGDTTPDGRVGVKIMGGKMLAVKIENLEVVGDHDTGFTSYQEAAAASSSEVHKSDLPEHSSKNGISSYLAAVVQTASFSLSQAPFCVAAAPLLLTKMSGQCCKAIIQTAVRSPLLPLFAIAATMSAMCEAAAVAPSANTDLEKLLSEESSSNTYKSHFPVICNSAKCSNFVENLLLFRFLIIVPIFIVVVAARSSNSVTVVEVDEQGVAGDLDSTVEETEQQKDEAQELQLNQCIF